MNDTKAVPAKPLYDVTVEQVCERLKQVRDGMIGNEGEAVIVARVGNPAVYGDVDGETLRFDLAPYHHYLVLEIPIGANFPVTDSENILDGFTPIE